MPRKKNRQRNPPAKSQPGPSQLQQQSVQLTSYSSGPLPPPSMLARYEEVVPGSAERIIAMAEEQSDHRRFLERTAIESNAKAQIKGQFYAFWLSLAACGGGFLLTYLGYPTKGFAMIVGTMVFIAGIFVTGKWFSKKERQQKMDALTTRAEQ